MRDRSIDAGKGLLVLIMVYCHVIQFFGYSDIFPAMRVIESHINLIVFPGFVFFFGRAVSIAYLDKTYRRALPGLVRTIARSYLAFALSGIGYLVLHENMHMDASTVSGVLTLTSIPGWSEFLIAFALYGVVTLVFFPLLTRIRDHAWIALAASLACVACTFIPYANITVPQLALFIGGTGQCYFPVVQFMPYFLAGIVCTSLSGKGLGVCAGLSVLCSGLSVFVVRMGWLTADRFPPNWVWILMPAAGVVMIQTLTWALNAVQAAGIRKVTGLINAGLCALGSRSLYYLLASNLVLFTLSAKNRGPKYDKNGLFPWNMNIATISGALFWTVVLFAAMVFVRRLAGRGGKKKTIKEFFSEL